jgi:ABC-type nitrate/sulfonate/bicarbonate transport system ATPase subunit
MTTSDLTPPRVQLDGVNATYVEDGVTLEALRDITFSVSDGEFIALVGPSGSGKSTLLDIISGLYAPSAGRVLINGEALPTEARLGMSAYMRQRDLLLPWRSALDNAALALEVHGVPKREARRRARERFPEFGLEGFEDSWPAQLSGGMRQRVAFLRTVLAERPLLLLDEPLSALDALNRVILQTWLLELWEKERQAVLFVTHDVDEAVYLADRVIVLSARPGMIVHTEGITLPRPRTREMLTSETFHRHRVALLESLGLLETPLDVIGSAT